MASVRIGGYKGVIETLKKKAWETPKGTLQSKIKNGDKGIFKRHIFDIDMKDVKQGIQKGKSLKGSKPCRQFTDVGDPLSVRVRRRSCHECECCIKLDPQDYRGEQLVAALIPEASDGPGSSPCNRQGYCGDVADVCKLELESGKNLPQTRGEKQKRTDGEKLARKVKIGDIICMKSTTEPQPVCLGVVEILPFKSQCNMSGASGPAGRIDVDDEIMQIRKLEPVSQYANVLVVTDRQLIIHTHSVRLTELELEGLGGAGGRHQRAEGGKYKIPEGTQQSVLRICVA
jgi:hypothetical protein